MSYIRNDDFYYVSKSFEIAIIKVSIRISWHPLPVSLG